MGPGHKQCLATWNPRSWKHSGPAGLPGSKTSTRPSSQPDQSPTPPSRRLLRGCSRRDLYGGGVAAGLLPIRLEERHTAEVGNSPQLTSRARPRGTRRSGLPRTGSLRQKDLLFGPVLHLCYSLLSFSPAARHCYARYLDEREFAADAWAVAMTGRPAALASALAKVARSGGRLPVRERVRRILADNQGFQIRRLPKGLRACLAMAPIILVILAGPALLEWHRTLETVGREILLAFGVLD